MVDPKEGRLIYPNSKHAWVRINNDKIAVMFLHGDTVTFLEAIHRLYMHSDLELAKVEIHSVLFPELYFEDPVFKSRSANVYYEDRHWNFQTSEAVILDANTIKEAVLPFLTFMDEHAIGVDYKMVKEYLGLKDEEEEE